MDDTLYIRLYVYVYNDVFIDTTVYFIGTVDFGVVVHCKDISNKLNHLVVVSNCVIFLILFLYI